MPRPPRPNARPFLFLRGATISPGNAKRPLRSHFALKRMSGFEKLCARFGKMKYGRGALHSGLGQELLELIQMRRSSSTVASFVPNQSFKPSPSARHNSGVGPL